MKDVSMADPKLDGINDVEIISSNVHNVGVDQNGVVGCSAGRQGCIFLIYFKRGYIGAKKEIET